MWSLHRSENEVILSGKYVMFSIAHASLSLDVRFEVRRMVRVRPKMDVKLFWLSRKSSEPRYVDALLEFVKDKTQSIFGDVDSMGKEWHRVRKGYVINYSMELSWH